MKLNMQKPLALFVFVGTVVVGCSSGLPADKTGEAVSEAQRRPVAALQAPRKWEGPRQSVAVQPLRVVRAARATLADSAADPSYDSHPLLIGADSANGNIFYNFTRVIDEVAVWLVARSASDIAADMATQTPTSSSSMAGYWSFNEGTGQVMAESSGNANSGTLGSVQTADGLVALAESEPGVVVDC